MNSDELTAKLESFAADAGVTTKGWLSVVLVGTEHAKQRGLPLDPDALKTEGEGQVLGLGMSQVQAILNRHGETRVLAKEGGRTSRGSMGNMGRYVRFLNALPSLTPHELDEIERFWVERVRAFFAGKPFKLHIDRGLSTRSIVRELVDQADKRQREGSGTQYVGALLQHLVGAKLRLILGRQSVPVASFSTSDEQTGRFGDFEVGDTVIHVTATPNEALIRKCSENIVGGRRPLVITVSRRVSKAEAIGDDAHAAGRIDVLDVEQFLATNLYEHGKFHFAGVAVELERLVDEYNAVIDEVETDPSLKIQKP